MRRSAFVGSALAWAAGTRFALATGGRDIDASPGEAHEMRVLLSSLATGPAGAPVAETLDPFTFRWNGRTYRGRYETALLPDGRSGLVNVVPIDAYLYGVVSKEVSAGWPRAALEAQAIVARTYVLSKRRPGKPYDVTAGESDQVYGGIQSETVEARDAVDATSGIVVVFATAPAHVAFGSCCGGHTADAAEIWGNDFPYLRGVVDPHCVIAPEYHWQRDVSYDEFIRALSAFAGSAGQLQRVELRELDDTGRARFVALVGDHATSLVKTTVFRTTLGTSLVRSTLLQDVSLDRGPDGPTRVTISGAGRGHGVGLCQWGARGMAQDGADATQIVQFYFPQTTLGKG